MPPNTTTSQSGGALVFVHGYALDSLDWEGVAWGDPFAGYMGRIPAGLTEAALSGSGLLMFGSAAVTADGKVEADVSKRWAQSHLVELVSVMAKSRKTRASLRATLEDVLAHRTLTTQWATNTQEEVEEAATVARQQGCSRLVLVSSPNHLPRCLTAALAAAEQPEHQWMRRRVSVCSSDTSYAAGTAADVAVLDMAGIGSDGQRAGELARRTGRLLTRAGGRSSFLGQWEEAVRAAEEQTTHLYLSSPASTEQQRD